MTIWMIKPIFGKHKWKNEKKGFQKCLASGECSTDRTQSRLTEDLLYLSCP